MPETESTFELLSFMSIKVCIGIMLVGISFLSRNLQSLDNYKAQRKSVFTQSHSLVDYCTLQLQCCVYITQEITSN